MDFPVLQALLRLWHEASIVDREVGVHISPKKFRDAMEAKSTLRVVEWHYGELPPELLGSHASQ